MELLNVSEAAELLCVSVKTLAKWRINGDGPSFVRLGGARRGRIVYRRADLVAYVEHQVVRRATNEASPVL